MSSIRKRSVNLDGHQTSVSVEDEVWALLRHLAREQGQSLSSIIGQIDHDRMNGADSMAEGGNLSSAIRMFVLHALAEKAELGHVIGK